MRPDTRPGKKLTAALKRRTTALKVHTTTLTSMRLGCSISGIEFGSMDTNHDGVIDKGEWKAAAALAGVWLHSSTYASVPFLQRLIP